MYKPYHAGVYTVTDVYNGCTRAATTNVEIIERGKSSLNLFPNPNKGKFTIAGNFDYDQELSIVIYNAIGQIVYTDKIFTFERKLKHEIVLPGIANGVYYLHTRITAGDKIIPFVVGQ